jgi:hypothetical protein
VSSGRIPEPFRDAFTELAKVHGDVALVDACAQLLSGYATVGARAALVKRKGDKEETCPRCRERDVLIRQIEENTRRVTRAIPQRGASPSDDEGR